MRDIVLSLIASTVTGLAVWLGQWALNHRRIARKRTFFGITTGEPCLMVTPRHWSSENENSVHRRDMAALIEFATIVTACGGQVKIVGGDVALGEVGQLTEFCLGGPSANPRMEAHLRSLLPNVRIGTADEDAYSPGFTVGTSQYPQASHTCVYAIVAKVNIADNKQPVFLVAGQTAQANLAAVRLLATRYRYLYRQYGTKDRFCLVLKVTEPAAFGPDLVDITADVTSDAFQTPDTDTGTHND